MAVKINSYVERDDGYIVYQTDSAVLPEVAYLKDRFSTKQDLIDEIETKVAEVNLKVTNLDNKWTTLKAELDKK